MGYYKFSKFDLLTLVIVFYVVHCENDFDRVLTNDRISLLSFMSGISDDPERALTSWNASNTHMCKWYGVECDMTMSRVVKLNLSHKSLRGIIAPALFNLSHLAILDLSGNFFEGRIPFEIGYLYELQELSLSFNLLKGSIPEEMGFLQKLTYLNLGSNKLIGEIPKSILCNGSSSLQYFDLSNNSLSGEIPLESQCELKELKFLLLWSNQLVGEVPLALSNITKLEWLDLEMNLLTGELPSKILSNLPNLKFLYLSYNHFTSHDGNTNLKPFFASLVNSSNLKEIDLAGNRLGGELPSIIGDLSTLEQINLDTNLIYGPIPPQISNLVNLTLLNLSSNLLNAIDLSLNNLSSSLPSQLGSCIALEYLNLSNNVFEGQFPASIGNLPYLKELDVSFNHFNGKIPQSVQESSTLKLMNFSYNNFNGNITNKGSFSSLTVDSFLGNTNLCGTIKGLRNCRRKRARHFLIAILLSLVITPVFCIVGLRSKFRRQRPVLSTKSIKDEKETHEEEKYPRITRSQLIQATGGFSPSSLIGSGRFGHVYKGILADNTPIAVKILDSKVAEEISGSFKRECQVLRRTRHRNLIRIITTCSRPDFKALVLPLMPNGSLEDHMYPRHIVKKGLDLVQFHASVQGDVYSFGVLLLEIVTGKRPTDVLFTEGSSMHEWVKSCYPNKLEPLIEEAIMRYAPSGLSADNRKIWADVIFEMIELGLICTQYNPSTRPTMLDVAHEVNLLKQYISSPSIEDTSIN
ncbi:hypothetical protein ACJIZ3_020692 [Penstemon smallii]|uniref:Protein kinase domain-containing protein n=1 Tax=Penstemon smallii TaxID=265156 RepID=A0ABD3SJK3_9LAMI